MLEAIILAGGAGTRLRSVVADLPKPMADVAGRPKHIYSIWNKMRTKQLDLDDIKDVRGLRVIVEWPAA